MSLLIDPRELINIESGQDFGPDRCGNCDCACYDGTAGPHQHCRCGHDWHDHLGASWPCPPPHERRPPRSGWL